jgi:hypothetical protein
MFAGRSRGGPNRSPERRSHTEMDFKSGCSCGGLQCPDVDTELFGELIE